MDIKDRYAELISLTRKYLTQEYASTDWIGTDLETFQIFKTYALQKKQKNSVHEAVVQTAQPVIARPAPPLPGKSAPLTKPSEAVATPSLEPKEKNTPPFSQAPPQPIESLKPKEPVAARAHENFSLSFVLEPLTDFIPLNYNELKDTFRQQFPNIEWLELPLAEEAMPQAKKVVQPEVIILIYQETGQHLIFMQNLARAIDRLLGRVKILSAAKLNDTQWETLKKNKELRLLITSYAGAQSTPGLMKHFKEAPRLGRHFFGKAPVCLLSDIDIYLKEPHLKLPLWQSIQSLYSHAK